jgi:hypothetical protein
MQRKKPKRSDARRIWWMILAVGIALILATLLFGG